MVTESDVLNFFRDELSMPVSLKSGRIPLEIDTVLQDYAELDELPYAIDDYSSKFGVDISSMNIEEYYPVVHKPLFTRLFKRRVIQDEINLLRKTVDSTYVCRVCQSGPLAL